jgi:hypothetical protein
LTGSRAEVSVDVGERARQGRIKIQKRRPQIQT